MTKHLAYTIILLVFLYGCSINPPRPKTKDFVGTWKHGDSTVLILNSDGTFIGKHLPYRIYFNPENDTLTKEFSGSGKWKFNGSDNFWKHQGWEMNLDFNWLSVKNYSGFNMNMIVRGEKGFWEYQPPWFLFLWVEEEGGDRYELHKN